MENLNKKSAECKATCLGFIAPGKTPRCVAPELNPSESCYDRIEYEHKPATVPTTLGFEIETKSAAGKGPIVEPLQIVE